MTPQMTSAPPPIPQPMSEASRLVGVFVSPKSTFPDIVRNPRWWVPVILLAIMATVVSFAYGRHVGWERMIRQQIERNPRMEQLSAAQREQAIVIGTRVTSYITYAAGLGVLLSVCLLYTSPSPRDS